MDFFDRLIVFLWMVVTMLTAACISTVLSILYRKYKTKLVKIIYIISLIIFAVILIAVPIIWRIII